jgi:hypothetical protein
MGVRYEIARQKSTEEESSVTRGSLNWFELSEVWGINKLRHGYVFNSVI